MDQTKTTANLEPPTDLPRAVERFGYRPQKPEAREQLSAQGQVEVEGLPLAQAQVPVEPGPGRWAAIQARPVAQTPLAQPVNSKQVLPRPPQPSPEPERVSRFSPSMHRQCCSLLWDLIVR